MGVSEWSLSRWCKQYGEGAVAADLEAEVVRLRREVELVSRQRDILKSLSDRGAGAVERYEMIAKMKSQPACPYSTAELCAALDVSPSGFYAHRQKAAGKRRQQDSRLAEQIGVLFLQSRGTYGCRRLRQELRHQQVHCGTTRVCRLMRQQGLTARQKRRFRPRITREPSRRAHCPQPAGPMA